MLAAVREELVETGFAQVTVEKVARRAGVAKTTVYARWRDLPGLVVDLLADLSTTRVPLPDTGSLDEDLRLVARRLLELMRAEPDMTMFRAIVATAVHHPEAREALSAFFRQRLATTAELVDRAIERGEVPPGTCRLEVVRTMSGAFYYRMFITGEPLTEAVADRAAAVAAHSARAGLLLAAPADGEGGDSEGSNGEGGDRAAGEAPHTDAPHTDGPGAG
ncbi:TetR/AcrR family transcriptional regulator [Kitasatospora sp. NPDC090091]|uniref:TetR/AcrR family transcriptional regulator n=1 Tax=Kitasatospora sp. NPDC090091 TaxID=3364081 RepID=UPI00380B82A8